MIPPDLQFEFERLHLPIYVNFKAKRLKTVVYIWNIQFFLWPTLAWCNVKSALFIYTAKNGKTKK